MQILTPFRVFSRPLNIPFFLIIVLTFFLPLLPFFLWKWEMDALGLNDLILIAWEPGQELLTTGTLNEHYPYPMWTLVTMLPFAMMEQQIAMTAWLILSLLMLVASLTVFMKIFDWDITVGLFTLLAFSFLTYFPMFLSLVMGQLSAFSLLVLALATYFFLHKRWTWLGIALGLSFIKPQVMPLLTGLLLLWALIQRRWQVWIGFGGTMAALVLISQPFISSPSQLIGGGISSHLSAFIKLTTTIWALFMNWGTTWHIPFVISILLLAWVGWLWFPFLLGRDTSDNRVRFLISIAVIVNLLVIPYSWIYNLALLLLPFGYSLSLVLKMNGWQKYAWLAGLFTTMHLLAFMIVKIFKYDFQIDESQGHHIIHALVFLAMMTYLEYRTKPKQS
jgi:hypothetical protein